MTYNGLNPKVRNTDALGAPMILDGFARSRVSNPRSLLAGKQVYGTDPLNFDTATSGNGNILYSATTGASQLQCTAGAAGSAIRQSFLYNNYQPGKSQLIFTTFRVASASNAACTFRVGYFDSSDGFYFEHQGGGDSLFVLRTSGLGGGQNITQPNWNIDTLDGSGDENNPSGILFDVDASQILFISFESLQVGTCVMGFVIDGELVPCHKFNFANLNTFDVTYMRTTNLPVRWELVVGADPGVTVGLDAICCSVQSEGGEDPVGNIRSANRGSTGGNSVASGAFESIIGIRLQNAGALRRAPVELSNLSIITTGTARYLWELHLNPTVTGQVWATQANSPVEIDVTGTTLTAAGTVLASGYASGPQGASVASQAQQSLLSRLSSNISGVPNEYALIISPIGSPETFYGSLGWFEYA